MSDEHWWNENVVLIVDDDERFRGQLARALERRGLTARKAEGYNSAMLLADQVAFDLAVIDLKMDGPNGLEVLQALHKKQPECEAIVLTGYGSIATAIDAVKLGATNYVQKPADADDVLAAFERGRNPTAPAETEYDAPSLARLEWEHINRVIEDCGGNISEAARRLGIHRRTLQRKLKTLPPKD